MNLLEEYHSLIEDAETPSVEEQQDEEFVVALLSFLKKDGSGGKGADMLEEACEELNVPVKIFDATKACIEYGKDKNILYNLDDKENGIILDPQKTIVICRRSVLKNSYTKNLVKQIQKLSVFVLNNLQSSLDSDNKFDSAMKLIDGGLGDNVPKVALVPNENYIDTAIEKVGNKFPVVAKTLTGTEGIGVFLIESKSSLLSIFQTIWKVSPATELLIQQKVDSDGDLRIHILGNKVLAAMKRIKGDKDFRTNYSLGNKTEKVDLTDEVKKIAVKAARIIGTNWAGVDIIIDKKGHPWILELNTSPGLEGIEKTSGLDISQEVIKFCLDKKNWIKSTDECGYKEKIIVEPIGELKAKLDTGAGTPSCSLHATNIEINKEANRVSWKTNKVDVDAELYGIVRIKNNYKGGTELIERPVVLLDIEFAGNKYEKIPFNLNDRQKKTTDVLLSRPFLIELGVKIDPAKEYMTTNESETICVGCE